MNRDELRTRSLATEVRRVQLGTSLCTYPIDPQGGGTWIGVNERGLSMALLNRTGLDFDFKARPFQSRGLIIPKLFEETDLDHSLRAFENLDLSAYPPFALVFIDGKTQRAAVYEDQAGLRQEKWEALFLSSSSERPQEVLSYREQLFTRFRQDFGDLPAPKNIESFHLTRDAAHPDQGILMRRKFSRTVSLSIVSFENDRASLDYTPIEEAGI